MPKLHEVLAVDSDLAETAKKIAAEALGTFMKKADHFFGATKRLEMFDESRKQEEEGASESKELVTTVQEKLDYVAEHIVRHLDCLAQKESTNQVAIADVEMEDGTKLLDTVPATLLLSLENKLALFRKMYEGIPTLAPGIDWAEDPTQKEGVYKAQNDIIRHKTEQTFKSKILVEPTTEHPAQIEKWTEQVPIGNFITTQWSGMVSPARKSELLGRIDALLRAIKKGRMRANSTEVIKKSIGKVFFDYIHK